MGLRCSTAFATFASVVAYCGVETYRHGFEWELWQWLWEHAVHLVTASTLFATAQAFYTYISSFSKDELLAEHGDTGNPIYDVSHPSPTPKPPTKDPPTNSVQFYIGRPLNPRIGSFDLKVFSELRPGMILWIILNFSYLAHQHTTHGRITDSMILVNLFQAWYVSDALWNEPAVLTTMDVVTDGFGYMLSFGDLVWVPFTYSLQARYLALYPVDLGLWGVLAVLAVQAIGYIVFRGANGQKNAFRRDPLHPDVSHLRYITTKSGSRLMISGWWGLARHVNYLGDWLMAWAWCLPTGFGSPIPYFYVAYFAVLLVHRERRDEAKCKAKYGEDWDRYTKIVPYRIVPGVY